MSLPHKTRPVQVWIDADLGIADMVEYLQTFPGLRTFASCQGTLGEGGASPYRSHVMAAWPPDTYEHLAVEFDVTLLGEHWGYLHPRSVAAADAPEGQP